MLLGPRVRQIQHPPARGVQDPDLAVQVDDQQSGREARDDLAAQALGRFSAGRGGPLLSFELRHRLLQRGGEQRRLRAPAHGAARVARGREETQHGEYQHRHEKRDDRGEAEDCVGGRRQAHDVTR